MTPADRDAAVALAREIRDGLKQYGDRGLREQMELLSGAVLALAERPTCDWQPIATAEKYGPPIRAFATELIDVDFNPSGSVEACWADDIGWIGAVWNADHDVWQTRPIQPTHWQPLPAPPTPSVTCSICRRDDCGGDHPCAHLETE